MLELLLPYSTGIRACAEKFIDQAMHPTSSFSRDVSLIFSSYYCRTLLVLSYTFLHNTNLIIVEPPVRTQPKRLPEEPDYLLQV